MPETSPLPFWLSTAPVSLAPLGGAQVTALLNATEAVVTGAIATSVGAQAKARDVNTRLTNWYQADVQPQVSQVQALTQAAAEWLDTTMGAGVHWYGLRPSFGAFAAVEDALTPGLTGSQIVNAPAFTETMYVGGILLLAVGPPYTLFQVSSALISAMTGKQAAAQRAFEELVTDSAVASPVATALADLTSLPTTLWPASATTIKDAFFGSGVASLLSQTGFPQREFQKLTTRVDRTEPTNVRERSAVTVRLIGDGFSPAEDQVRLAGVDYKPTADSTPSLLKVTLPAKAPGLATVGTQRLFVRRKNESIAWIDIPVRATTGIEELAEIVDEDLYAWHKVTSFGLFNTPGSVAQAAALIPGVTQAANTVLATLDNIGDPAAGAAVNNFVLSALRASEQRITSTASRAQLDLQRIKTGIQQFRSETAALQVLVLVIPPALGGNHQLGYALRQGLNGFAQNTPDIDPDAGVTGLFVCAGDTDRTKARDALNSAASVLNLASWTPLL